MFRHMVLMKFRPEVTSAMIEDVFKALADLQGTIPGLLSFSGGVYSSSEGLNQGFTHGFSMDFNSLQERDAYFPHPDHEFVKGIIVPLLADGGILTFDYEF
mmetsp:Transcript_26303/g.37697  ORF Transcript_26303/g.37697 Transcript_26303/m.37697 type:complete len:101 (+) Transcript_26303:147-449(+)